MGYSCCAVLCCPLQVLLPSREGGDIHRLYNNNVTRSLGLEWQMGVLQLSLRSKQRSLTFIHCGGVHGTGTSTVRVSYEDKNEWTHEPPVG